AIRGRPAPDSGRDGRRRRLGLEVARAVAVEPALAEPQPLAQDLLEHLAFQAADRPVQLGQLVIWAGMLAEERQVLAVPSHLHLDPADLEQAAELGQPPFPSLA